MSPSTSGKENSTAGIPVVERALEHGELEAVLDEEGCFTYAELLTASEIVALRLLAGRSDLAEARVGFAVAPGFRWLATLWGIWRSGGIAVPLCLSHPLPEQQHVVRDSEASILVFDLDLLDRGRQLEESCDARLLVSEELCALPLEKAGTSARKLPSVAGSRRALIIYSSGTTGTPKGVVSSHLIIAAQIDSLVTAWEFSSEDRSLLVLPLHHVHGIIVVVGCTLWAGGRCEMMRRFSPPAIWQRLAGGEVSLFMGVPTVYSKLVEEWDAMPTLKRLRSARASARLRLMACGSAALSKTLQQRWQRITGHVLLERYGATETGIVLSNPLHGERPLGYVGQPLPGIELRLVGEDGEEMEAGTAAEIEVRGDTLFLEYWRDPEATCAARRDGWYRTGDLVVVENGFFRILGRKSVDILKSGGFKVSALEIESTLVEHRDIRECAVFGLPDEQWGELVVAAVVLEPGSRLEVDALRAWAKERLATYKVPSLLLALPELPRNAMGKVVKPTLTRLAADLPDR